VARKKVNTLFTLNGDHRRVDGKKRGTVARWVAKKGLCTGNNNGLKIEAPTPPPLSTRLDELSCRNRRLLKRGRSQLKEKRKSEGREAYGSCRHA
jgi:hypothetical protein